MRVTNEQIMNQVKSIDTRLTNVESILMGGKRNGYISPTITLLIKYVVFPLIVIVGGIVGVNQVFPFGG